MQQLSPPPSIYHEGRLIACVGLQATLWLPGLPERAHWLLLWALAARYAALMQPQLNWWSSSAVEGASRDLGLDLYINESKLADEAAENLAEGVRLLAEHPFPGEAPPPPAEGVADIALGYATSLETSTLSVNEAMFYVYLDDPGSSQGGYVRIHWPWYFATQPERYEAVEQFMREAITLLSPTHGTLGWGVHLPLAPGFFAWELDCAIALYPLLEQFPGLDCYEPFEQHKRLSQACYTPNWITFISSHLLAKAGVSMNSVKRNLLPVAEVSELGGGLYIKAGRAPQLEPSQDPSTQLALTAISRTLVKVRAPTMPNYCIAPPPDGYADQGVWENACNQYLQRFD